MIEEIIHKIDSSDYQQGLISTVITIDSPLHGVPPTQTILGALLPGWSCIASGTAGGVLVGLHNNEPTTTDTLRHKVVRAKERGVAVTAIGNTYDCVWAPAICRLPLVGDIQTQWIFDSSATNIVLDVPTPYLSPRPSCFIGTHGAILDSENNFLHTIADRIGRQN